METRDGSEKRRGRVSVVIPTYYRNGPLRETIESVRAQTYPDVELVVVDDSGEGYARSVVEPYELTYVEHEENRGGNPARNTGLEVASGEYVQLLDDDDRLDDRKIERQVESLRSAPDAGVVYSGFRERGIGVTLPAPGAEGDVLDRALTFELRGCIPSTMLVEASVLDAVRPLADREAADDVGMVIELARRTRFVAIREPLVTKGRPGTQRHETMGVPRELERMLEEYADLYDQRDPRVRATAVRNVHRAWGGRLLNQRLWSARAVLEYWLALYHAPEVTAYDIASALAALFGRPGRDLGLSVYRSLRADSSEAPPAMKTRSRHDGHR